VLSAAECYERGASRVARRHPAARELRGLHVDVKLHLVAHVALVVGAMTEAGDEL
jgi:hypothetical protein